MNTRYFFDSQFGLGRIVQADQTTVVVSFPNIHRKVWYILVDGILTAMYAIFA